MPAGSRVPPVTRELTVRTDDGGKDPAAPRHSHARGGPLQRGHRLRSVTTVILLRHGRTTANAGGVLAGWTPGVQLDESGAAQVRAVGERLAKVPLAAVVSSPLERCRQTADAVASGRELEVQTDDRLGEARYGDWTGRTIKELAKEPLWKVVQQHPSAAVFPGPEGEGLAHTQARAVAAVRQSPSRHRREQNQTQ